MTKEALKLALEALERIDSKCFAPPDFDDATIQEIAQQALTAIKEALAQPAHIGFMDSKLNPIQRTWVGLTYEDMVGLQKDLYDAKGESVLPTTFAMAVEAKLKDKNDI